MAPPETLTTPVLFIIFNRPEKTKSTFEVIRKVRPRRLYISADGPRAGKADDVQLCQQTRDIMNQIDWDCEVHKNYSQQNKGLKSAVSSAISWFFENVDEGIILEDDCLPVQSFFWFCQELLERYRDDKRIMCISGSNSQNGIRRGDGSYYFSKVPGIWGWATWKRAWNHFSGGLETFKKFKENNLIHNIFESKICRDFWLDKIDDVYKGGNSWGFVWAYTVLINNGLCITSNVNLISNIGFGENAVHATDPNSRFANIPASDIKEIIHPTFILPDLAADDFLTMIAAREQLPPVNIIKRMLKLIIPSWLLEVYRRNRKDRGRQNEY